MKKSLIALAALAAVGAASAQSSVTISGRVAAGHQTDLSVPHASASTVANVQQLGGSTTAVSQISTNGQQRKGTGLALMDTTLRISAVEDLGGGLRANFLFTVEGSREFRGAAITRADSGIGLTGPFGEIGYSNTRSSDALASVVSPAVYLADSVYDASGILARGGIDTLTYQTPQLAPGLRLAAAYVENQDGAVNPPGTYTTTAGYAAANAKTYVLGATYTQGPMRLVIQHKTKHTNALASSGMTTKANTELFARYDLGVAAIALGYDGAERTGTSNASAGVFASTANAQAFNNNFAKAATGVSVTVPLGALSVGAQHFKRGTAKMTDFGAVYSLSKRTAITAAVGKKSGLANDNSGHYGNQHRVSLRHDF